MNRLRRRDRRHADVEAAAAAAAAAVENRATVSPPPADVQGARERPRVEDLYQVVEPPTTTTTITNTALDMTAEEAIAATEAEGEASQAEAAALGAAKRALNTLKWPTSQEEWAPTAAALTRIHEDLANTDLGRWRFGGGPIRQTPQ